MERKKKKHLAQRRRARYPFFELVPFLQCLGPLSKMPLDDDGDVIAPRRIKRPGDLGGRQHQPCLIMNGPWFINRINGKVTQRFQQFQFMYPREWWWGPSNFIRYTYVEWNICAFYDLFRFTFRFFLSFSKTDGLINKFYLPLPDPETVHCFCNQIDCGTQ